MRKHTVAVFDLARKIDWGMLPDRGVRAVATASPTTLLPSSACQVGLVPAAELNRRGGID